MRALHLVYLRGPGGKKLRYYPTEFEALIIPWWFSGSDREIIIAFYQQVLGDEPLPRVEVDWYRSLVPADRTFLQHVAEKRRSTEHLVVVKVRRKDVDLRDVLTHPDLQPFRYVAVTCDHSLPNETFGRISELTGFVSQTAEELYEEMAAEFSLRDDGPELLAPLVQTLLNPILVVEAYNALIDVQAERVDPDKQMDAVYRRILRRLLEDMAPRDAIALCAFALRGRIGFDQAIPEKQRPRRLEKLTACLVLRDDRLVRWAAWLQNPAMGDVVDGRVRAIANPQKTPLSAKKVLEWLDTDERSGAKWWIARHNIAMKWLNEGQIGRLRDELEVLERTLTLPTVTDFMRAKFWSLVGQLRLEEWILEDAAAAFRRCVECYERVNAPAGLLGAEKSNLAWVYVLSGNERWNEAERLFREALELKKEGNDTPTSIAYTMSLLARGLRDHEQWNEAEQLFREAIHLREGGTAVTIDHFARGLRDNGRWKEAEPLFQEALRLKVERGDSKVSRAATMRELARGLQANGQKAKAAKLVGEALQLMADLGNDSPAQRALELRKYAHAMRIARRLDEANEIESLAAQIESSS